MASSEGKVIRLDNFQCEFCCCDWLTDKVQVYQCKLCDNNKYYCQSDGDRKHSKMDHNFTPDIHSATNISKNVC